MADRLERYRQMRDFSVTPEPSGRAARSRAARADRGLRYYVQRHAATRLHYDFRLELDGVLKSWAVPKGPSLDPADKRLAMQTEDHPLDYGDFEGVIPEKQYGAGEVLLWDQGVWLAEDRDPAAALAKGRLHFRLDGEKLHGAWILTRTSREEDRPAWLLIKRRDEDARPGVDITEERPESVKRAPRPAKYGKRSALPQFVAPQLATLSAAPPKHGEWIYEVKHDGYRMLARLAPRDARLFTRSGKEWTAKLPHLARELKRLRLEGSWLDGEIVVLREDGRSSFQRLQNAFESGRDGEIVYFVFDAPYLKGEDLRALPLAQRKKRLHAALKGSRSVRFSDHLEGEASEVLEKACQMQLEGLIGKRTDAPYVAGRSQAWIKLKCRQRQDFVIAGFTPPAGARSGFGALLLATYDERMKLRYAGKVGTGFNEQRLAALADKLSRLKRSDSPLADPPRERGVRWVKPRLVCEVTFAERTDEGILRQASFVGLREDIAPKSVHEERAQPAPPDDDFQGIRISHPKRIVYPELRLTKLDLARYYDAVGEWLLPHLAGRPLTLVRCPDGVAGECFYQRHLGMGASPGDVKTFRRLRSSKGYYIYVDSRRGILSMVQNGALEMHTWGATLPDTKHPDRVTLDLDPGEDLPWAELRRAAEMTRAVVEGLGLRSFLKTTGGKGLHVVVPIAPLWGWDAVKEFSRLIAQFLVRAERGFFTARIAKAGRTGKVFVDYLRNSETASAVAAFSARARANAGVSTPLAWDELGREDLRGRFTVLSVPPRLASLGDDPWRGYAAAAGQRLSAAMRRSLGADRDED
ncbi:MAG TPA: DNA ligase D [Burkholderiales bacterium]|nr:DNA ligase D [Burkholderiales bacterium]